MEQVQAVKKAYRLLYRSGLKQEEALAQIEQLSSDEGRHLVEFIRKSERGICRESRGSSPSGQDYSDARAI